MLKKMNWENVPNYKVTRLDMSEFRDFSDQKLLAALSRLTSFGILSGSELSVGDGLDVTVSEALLFFEDANVLVETEESVVTLDAADPANPRYDRIEYYFEETDSREAVNDKGVDVVVTKNLVATIRVVKGNAGAVPVVPPRTAGAISSGIVLVQAASAQLVSSDIVQDERYKNLSIKIDLEKKSYVVANNDTTLIPILLDESRYKLVVVEYDCYRKTDINSANGYGELIFSYDIGNDEWKVVNTSRFDDLGIVFSIAANGYVQCVANNMAGSDYESFFSVANIRRVERQQ